MVYYIKVIFQYGVLYKSDQSIWCRAQVPTFPAFPHSKFVKITFEHFLLLALFLSSGLSLHENNP